ncbi:MAG: hypothetical protein SPK29_05380 [Peptoniphilaceae bacterium]|nr:hypothetical protein [Peptoniphilaceae bacterium]
MSNVKYALMNKNRVVLDFLYDIETHHIVKIPALYDNRYKPPAVIGIKGISQPSKSKRKGMFLAVFSFPIYNKQVSNRPGVAHTMKKRS